MRSGDLRLGRRAGRGDPRVTGLAKPEMQVDVGRATIWDLSSPEVSPRSRCYNLTPEGLGTELAESLTSYLGRLANAHSVTTRALVLGAIRPVMSRGWRLGASDWSVTVLWAAAGRAMNGSGITAGDWCDALQTLTLRNDLRCLTFLTWKEVLDGRRLLRRVRAYCPECYDEWRGHHQVVYDPLLWAVSTVTVCPRHRSRLRLRCLHKACLEQMPLLSPRSRLGHCPRCEGWLGASSPDKEDGSMATGSGSLEEDLWIASAVGELIASSQSVLTPFRRETLLGALAVYDTPLLSHGIAAPPPPRMEALRFWRRGKARPSMRSLLELCRRLDTSPLRFFSQVAPSASRKQRPAAQLFGITHRRRYAVDERGHIQNALEAILASESSPSMSEVTGRLGYGDACLRKLFPALCKAISARSLARSASRAPRGWPGRPRTSAKFPGSRKRGAPRVDRTREATQRQLPLFP
jgi:hypothetical protein